ncbi:MAG: ATP-binding protein [Candidatus Micrarchaeia archaeon]
MRRISGVVLPNRFRMGSRDLRHRTPREDLCLPRTMREPLLSFTRHTLNNSFSSLVGLLTLPFLPEKEKSKTISGILADYKSLRAGISSRKEVHLQMRAVADMQEFFLNLQRKFVLDSETSAFDSSEERQMFSRLINKSRVQLDKLMGILNGDPYRQFPEKFSLFRLVGDLMPQDEKGTRHHVYRCPDDQPVFLFADRFDTAMILENFFSNAVRACERKGVFPFVEVFAFIVDDPPQMAEITIRDKGIGFTTEELILLRNGRGFTSKESIGQDHGIGLAHCRFLIEQHCGRFDISSRKGDGTDIIFTLPAHAADE